MNMAKSIAGFLTGVLLFSAAQHSHAQSGELKKSSTEESAAPLRPDVEVDPAPYFEHGYSFHAGIGWGRWRVEGEALGTDVPAWVRGNKGFDVSYHGGGAKLQYFLSPQQNGMFVGMRTEITRESIKLHATDLESRPIRHDLGLDAGYRFRLGQRLYITPWAGVDYTFDAQDIEIGARTYKEGRFGIFAAVHFGYRF
jgi:hypothetical protein